MEQESPAHRARKKDPQRGAATVELGLVMALVMMLVVGIIDMGRAIHAYSSLTHAAGRAARWAAVRSSLSDAPASISMIEAKALSDAVGLDPDKVEVVTDWAPANAPGGVVSVTAPCGNAGTEGETGGPPSRRARGCLDRFFRGFRILGEFHPIAPPTICPPLRRPLMQCEAARCPAESKANLVRLIRIPQ
jgi:hypothetical protein